MNKSILKILLCIVNNKCSGEKFQVSIQRIFV